MHSHGERLRCGHSAQQPHPASALAFDWDQGNEDKLLRRGIGRGDVEAVHANRPRYRRNKRDRAATWLMVGPDSSGRELVIGIVWADPGHRVLRAVTGWPVERT